MKSKVQNVIIEDINSNQFSLSELSTTNPILIYRYSELNCNTCYETETILLKSIFEHYQNKVVILCSYEMKQHFITFKRINRISFPIYRISKDAFDWELEEYSEPYYFVLHSDMRVSRIYMPNINYPELNKQYLEGIKRFLIN